jgi:hypothetical protein
MPSPTFANSSTHLVPQNVLKGTALERKQAPLSNVHDALFPPTARWRAERVLLL